MRYRLLNTPLITSAIRVISFVTLKVLGWTIEGEIPAHVKKYVAIVAPHTSNWDFPIMLMAAFILRVDVHWIGKHTLFSFPFQRVMSYLGGIPVNREVRNDNVAKVIAMFNARDEFAIGIAPEGTRRATSRWHSGCWHISHDAGVPLYLAFIDYKTKRAGVSGGFQLSDNVESDMERIKLFYSNFRGRYPEKFRI